MRYRKFRIIAVILTAVVAIVIGVVVILMGNTNPKALFVPVDPPGKEEADRWDATLTLGLRLRVLNACSDGEWTALFDASLSDWNSSPSLQLTLIRSTQDLGCQPVMK